MQYNYINYQSNHAVPDDINSFYNELLEQTTYSNLEVKALEGYDQNVSVNDLYFIANDGARIYSKYVYPKHRKINKVLLMFHGYHVDSGGWFDKIAFANLGIAVFALDCRGQSGKSQDNTLTSGSTMKGLVIKGINEGVNNLHMIKQYLDTYRLGLIAQDLYPELTIDVIGESQGGALALVAASLLNNVSTCVTQYPYLCDIKQAYDDGYGYSGINDYFTWEDPLATTYEMFFDTLAYIDVKNLASRITADVHLLVGHKDDVCPPKCQFAMYNNLQTTKHYYIYPEKGHEHLHNSEDLKMKLLTKSKEK